MPKVGDMVFAKVTKYQLDNDTAVPTITHKNPMWMCGVYTNHQKYDIYQEELLTGKFPSAEWCRKHDWEPKDISLNNKYDTWELVPYSRVPGKVLAVFAKKILLGELEDCGED